MAFRRSDKTLPGSSRWRAQHRETLLSCGIPDSILSSDRALTYVLLHGDDELETGWRCSELTREEAQRLLQFLDTELAGSAGYDLVDQLRRRLRDGSG